MKAKLIKENLNILPTWDEIMSTAPELIKDYVERCKTTPQSPIWHPEGEVYKHIRLVFDRAREYGDLNLLISSLFHDLGKVDTTAPNKQGTYSAHGHELVSARLVKRYAEWIKELGADPDEVHELVFYHMKIKLMDKMRPSKREVMKNNPHFDKLNKFTEFDHMQKLSNEEKNRYSNFR